MLNVFTLSSKRRVWVGLRCLLFSVTFPPHPHLPCALERGWHGLLLESGARLWDERSIRKKL